MILVAVGVFIIGIGFTFFWSFTSSKLFPNFHFVGLEQYARLWRSDRWQIAVHNIWIFGLLSIGGNMVFGYLLAVFMDQRIQQEDLLRSIFLYPFAMSLIVTGLVWQWALDPNLGIAGSDAPLGLGELPFRAARRLEHRDLRPRRRRRLAGQRRDHGDPARRPARHRRGDLEGGEGRRHSALGAPISSSRCR